MTGTGQSALFSGHDQRVAIAKDLIEHGTGAEAGDLRFNVAFTS